MHLASQGDTKEVFEAMNCRMRAVRSHGVYTRRLRFALVSIGNIIVLVTASSLSMYILSFIRLIAHK